MWHPLPEDLRAKRCNWDDIRSLIQDEYGDLWENLIAPQWEAVVSTPFYLHEINYDGQRGIMAMQKGNQGRRIQRKKDWQEKWAAEKIQARFRGNAQRFKAAQHKLEQVQHLQANRDADDDDNDETHSSKWRSDMVHVVSALKVPPSTRSEDQLECLVKWLRYVPFFRANVKSRNEMIQICQKLRHVEYMPGAVLVRQGDIADEFFTIVKGTVAVWQSEHMLGTQVQPVSLFISSIIPVL